jgi:hypothetical protein
MNDTILWRRLDRPGHEFGRLASRSDGWQLSGTAVFAHEAQPCQLGYLVTCDSGWRTVLARVKGWVGGREIDIDVSVDAEQRWRLNGADCPAVAGALDIDLGFSPSTNLLPIRRLALEVGEEAEVRAAWLPFPALMFQPLAQVYRREAETSYRYASGGGSFVRLLEVNSTGFVMSYPGLWQAEPSI